MYFLRTLTLLFCLIVFACGGDDNGNNNLLCGTLGTTFQTELNALVAASEAYSYDPTPATCNAYKDAYNNYIDALEGWENCAITLGQQASWQQSIDEARAEVNAIVC